MSAKLLSLSQAIWLRELKDYLMIAIGLIFYGIGWTVFLLPNDITSGGVPGISSIVYWATGIPVQYTYFVINAFQYPVLNDLIKVSDILISDYSSIVFDYSIMERPIFCYGYDYDTYSAERGLYTDLDTLFSHGVLRTEDEVLNAIQEINYERECEYTRSHIKHEYIATYGDAAEKAIQIIFKE